MMRLLRFGVMGRPIAHSLSPLIHTEFSRISGIALSYEAILVAEGGLSAAVFAFFQNGGHGLNITQPFKEEAYKLCQWHSKRAKQAMAVNTLWMKAGQLCGDNTDGVGLVRDLSRYQPLLGQRILILGAGGAVRGILGPLFSQLPTSVALANRSFLRAERLSDLFPRLQIFPLDAILGEFDVLIYASSAALTHQTLILPDALIKPGLFCYDLSYKLKGDTPFVAFAKSKGARAVDGLGMLIEQAAAAFERWHGLRPNTASLKALLSKKSTHFIG